MNLSSSPRRGKHLHANITYPSRSYRKVATPGTPKRGGKKKIKNKRLVDGKKKKKVGTR